MSTATPPAPSTPPAPAPSGPAAPGPARSGHAPAAHARRPPAPAGRRSGLRRARGHLERRTTPDTLKRLLAGLIILGLCWGAAATWTVARRAAGAHDVVAVSEPLSYDAEQIYRSLSDADATEAAAFLAASHAPPAEQARYRTDIARAASYIHAATAASGARSGDRPLAILATDLNVYTATIAMAYADNLQDLPVGAAYLAEASSQLRTVLLPAADRLYAQENARVAADDRQATGQPVQFALLSLLVGAALLQAQWWLTRRTRRIVNYGLLGASAVLVLAFVWVVAGVAFARTELHRADRRGAVPVSALAAADITALQAHADESLTLIEHDGQDSYQADFAAARRHLGPGPGTLLTVAADAAQGSRGARDAARAVLEARRWYAGYDQL
jgi:hypothetical protein